MAREAPVACRGAAWSADVVVVVVVVAEAARGARSDSNNKQLPCVTHPHFRIIRNSADAHQHD